MMSPRLLVVAKAPVPGQAKTRLGRRIGMEAAADVAAAALLDTLRVGASAFPSGARFVALSGDLLAACRGEEIRAATAGWHVFDQRGESFDQRLCAAYADLPGSGPVVQIGMDTPQVHARDLGAVADALIDSDAVLGPAPDGGWWVLGLRSPADAVALLGVAMSLPTTYAETRRALESRGLRVGAADALPDVDTVEDAIEIAADHPSTEFARAWSRVGTVHTR